VRQVINLYEFPTMSFSLIFTCLCLNLHSNVQTLRCERATTNWKHWQCKKKSNWHQMQTTVSPLFDVQRWRGAISIQRWWLKTSKNCF
jgi:hypothetical protein